MPSGIQVFNEDGTLQFDTSNRLYRMLTIQYTGTSNGSVNVSGLSSQGTAQVDVLPTGTTGVSPSVNVSGDVVSWDFGGTPTDSRRDSYLSIGVF
ncbi:hypothetical protein V1318_13150 [Lysobacter sp. CCNWLW3]|uniref:hypothetical protein n=1 Tax=unclassified Lysobacter TaxID=2635362 RepID=UPI002FD6892C